MDSLIGPVGLLLVAGIAVIAAVLIVVLRRRRAATDVLPPPELSQPMDYTSMPVDEPQTFADRVRAAPPAIKLLIGLVVIVLLLGIGVLYYAFSSGSTTGPSSTTAISKPSITNVSARVSSETKISVRANTDLPDGSSVTAAMQENGQPFEWFDPNSATTEVQSGSVVMTLEKRADGPVPQNGNTYTITLSGEANGQQVSSEPAQVSVPALYQAAFFQVATATPEPSAVPTTSPTAVPQTTTIPAATAAPQVTTTPALTITAKVFNGGNIREQPNLQGRVLGQINAGETVGLKEKTVNGQWYLVDAPEADGWVSVTLLTLTDQTIAQVPIQGQTGTPLPSTDLTARVFNGGNVRASPSLQGRVLDQINAAETVQLLAKTANGQWYQIRNVRNVTGWVSVTLLTIPAETVARVPVAQ